MKKMFFLLGLVTLALAGYIMFKILTVNDGKENSENDSSPAGSPVEETSQKTGEETGKGIDP